MKSLLLPIKFIGTFIISLIALEWFLILSEISLPSTVYDDHEFGRSHRPNSKIFEISSEGFCLGKVNKYGYLGPAYTPEKPPNTLRIALIGDSYVEGFQIFDRYHFRKLLENELSVLTHKRVEVLNFGIGGIDFRDMYLLYKKKILGYNPDLVLFFINDDDLIEKNNLPAPQLYLEKSSIKISYDFRNSREYQLRQKYAFLRNFALGNLLKEAYEFYSKGETSKILFDKLNPFEFAVFKKKNNQPKIKKRKDTYKQINCAILKELVKDENHNATKNILVITFAFPEFYQELANEYGLNVFYLNKVLFDYKKRGINLEYWKATNMIGHWNHMGHRVVARFLSKQIDELYKKD